MKCPLCGAEKDLVTVLEHIGGKGDFEPVIGCWNSVACWNRWNKDNGLPEYVEEAKA